MDAITLFLQILLYSSSFVGTPKKEIREAALEQRQLKIEQFSSGIVRFSTKHEDNSFTLCSTKLFYVSPTFLFIFHAGSHRLGPKNFRNFPVLMTMVTVQRRIEDPFKRLSYIFFSAKKFIMDV